MTCPFNVVFVGWEAVFFIDLPSAEDRALLFRRTLEKHKQDLISLDLEKHVASTEGFSNSEVVRVVIDAIYESVQDGSPQALVQDCHIQASIASSIPASMHDPNLQRLRQLVAEGKMRSASKNPSNGIGRNGEM